MYINKARARRGITPPEIVHTETMRNTREQGRVSFLIYGNDGHFTGICRQFGFVEEGATFDQVKQKLESGATLLLEAVKKNPSLEPSLNTAPPFKYLCTFYGILFFATIAQMYYDCISFTTSNHGLVYA